MQTVQKIYRSSYTGENVVTNMTYSEGTWNFDRETVANSVVNNQVSNKAVIIGNGISRKGFDLSSLTHHKGGLLASGALQSYGCNALYRDFAPNFLVAAGEEMLKEIANSDYSIDHIVYANAGAILDYPGKYYLIPQDPSWNTGAIATYLACFDGHKTVYLMGFDGIDTDSDGYNVYAGTAGYPDPTYGHSEEFWAQAMVQVFNTYSDVDFVRVTPTANFRMPESWKYVLNLRQITFNEFTYEVDL